MKVIHRFVAGVALLPFVLGCGSGADSESADIIPFCKMERLSFSELPERVFSAMEYIVPETGENQDMLFSSVDQVEYKDGKLYILDWRYRRLVVFDSDGQPVSSLRRQGRGPGEYLQITDFDVDRDGSLWVVDGQKDILLHYSPTGECIGSRDFPYEAEFIKVLEGDRFLFSLAPWDSSGYGGKRIVVTDRELNVDRTMLEYGKFTDRNYAFPSAGFSTVESAIYYHRPVDDCVYALTEGGDMEKRYVFDFGQRRVPDKARKDIGKYRSDYDGYTMLVKSVGVGEDYIIGSVLEGQEIKDFMVDRTEGTVHILTESGSGMYMAGISGGHAIYRESHDDADNPDTAEEVLVLVAL